MPINTEKVMILSAQPYCRVAEMTPAMILKSEQIKKAVPERIRVA